MPKEYARSEGMFNGFVYSHRNANSLVMRHAEYINNG
jgi:hypothetical protein